MSDFVQIEFTEWFEDELGTLPPDQKVRVLKRIALLERKGWIISAKDEDVVPLDGIIWEIRIVGRGPAYRVLCFQVPGHPGRIVVLTNCVKKGLMKKRKVGNAEIARARMRRERWLSGRE